MTNFSPRIWTILKVCVVVGLLVWLIQGQSVKWEYFLFDASSVPWIAAAAVMILCSIGLMGTRYWNILRVNGVRLPLFFVVKTELAATFFSMCSLGPVGGDIVRSYYMYKQSDKALIVAGSTLVDRLFGLYVLFCMSTAGLLLHQDVVSSFIFLQSLQTVLFTIVSVPMGLGFAVVSRGLMGRLGGVVTGTCLAGFMAAGAMAVMDAGALGLFLFFLAGGIVVGGGVMFFWDVNRLDALADSLANRSKFGSYAAQVFRALLIVRDNPLAALVALILSFVQQSLLILAMQSVAIAMALPVTPTLGDTFFATSMTFILSTIPMPGAGLGVSETSMDFLMSTMSPEVLGGASVYLCFRAWLILMSATGLPFYISLSGKVKQA